MDLNKKEEIDHILLKLLKNRVILRDFHYLIELNQEYLKYPKLLQSLYEKTHINPLSRGQIISLIKEDAQNFSTYRASTILNRLINRKIIKLNKGPYEIETYSSYYVIMGKKIHAKAQPIADFLKEDIQSVITALKSLKKINLKTTVPISIPLVTNKREKKGKREINCWTLTNEGLKIGGFIRKIFENPVKMEKNGKKVSKSIGILYDETCSEILEKRYTINSHLKRIDAIQNNLQTKFNECATIRGTTLNEILYELSNSKTKDKMLVEDTEILLETIKFIKSNIAFMAEIKMILKSYNKQLQNILDAQKGIFDIEDFPNVVLHLFNNLKNIKEEFFIPKLYDFEKWNALTPIEKDISISEKEKKSFSELIKVDYKSILDSIEHIYELKFNIENHLENVKSST